MKVSTAQTTPTFADFWTAYPKKRAKLDAEKAWGQAMKRGARPEAILASLKLMLETEWRRRKPEYLPYPATFLRAEAFDERVETLEDEKPELSAAYLCEDCESPHEWHMQSDTSSWLTLPRDRRLPCPEAIERMKVRV